LGGVFCTGTVGGFTPSRSSEAVRRSSEIVRTSLATAACKVAV
jgi:hypothetical protein